MDAKDDERAIAAMNREWAAWLESVTQPSAYPTLARAQPPLPPLLTNASLAAFTAGRVKFNRDYPHFGAMDLGPIGVLYVDFSPNEAHRALTLKYREWPGALVWVDQCPVTANTDNRADLALDNIGRWLDDDIFSVQIGGLEHPLADPRVHTELGTVLGLLLYDAVRHQSHLVLPKDDENWPDPRATRHPGRFDIHIDKQAMLDQRVARSVAWP